jgi:hypothetical protein
MQLVCKKLMLALNDFHADIRSYLRLLIHLEIKLSVLCLRKMMSLNWLQNGAPALYCTGLAKAHG